MEQALPGIIILSLVSVFYVFSQISGRLRSRKITAAIAQGAVVLDVRSAEEYARGHYEGALNIPVNTLTSKLKKLGGTEKTIIVYCASGGRSGVAAGMLHSAGFANVINAGGLHKMPK